jgi:hypothetical protein
VTFLEARLGEEEESKIRFKVSLKSVVVSIEASHVDPIKVVPATVDRGNFSTIVETNEQIRSTASSGMLDLGISTNTIPLKGGASAKLEAGYSNTSTQQSSRTLGPFDVSQFKSGEAYCWTVSSRSNQPMIGKVWDANSQPRCHVKLTSEKAQSEDCLVNLKVHAKREDIEVREVAHKEKDKIRLMFGKDNNIAAAEAVIRHLLSEKGLPTKNFSEPYQDILLSNISVPEEK